MDPSYFLLFAPLHLHSLSTITSLIKQGKHKTRSHKTRSEITQVFREENKEDCYSNPSLPLDILFPNKHSPKLSLLGQRTYWLLTPGWPGQKRMPPQQAFLNPSLMSFSLQNSAELLGNSNSCDMGKHQQWARAASGCPVTPTFRLFRPSQANLKRKI